MTPDAAPHAPRLLPALPVPGLPEPDDSQAVVLEHVRAGGNLVVLGAPGTGKTSLALRLLVRAVDEGRDAVLLTPTRVRASVLRGRAAHLLRARGVEGGTVRVRTPAALALSVLTTSLTQRPAPLPAPVLLAGAEEDAALASLIRPEDWPGLPPETLTSRAFRSQLRDLLARAGELGVGAEELAALGQDLDVPVWGPASGLLRLWDAQGRPSARRRAQTRRMDTARLQDRAREALGTWEADGVMEPRPVPDLVVVDDYQDCTAATARLLGTLAVPDALGHAAQVIVLGNPDTAVETFRGGTPSLLSSAQEGASLGAARLVLGTVHRGGPALAEAVAAQAARVPVVGATGYRQARAVQETVEESVEEPGGPVIGASVTDAAPAGPSVVLASSPAQEATHVARILRGEHIHHATGWDQMAVIVRSTAQAQAVARDLRRRGVPLASRTPAVLLRTEPAARALTEVVRAALDGDLGQDGQPPLPEAVQRLLTGPLIGLSPLDLRRLRRRIRVWAEGPASRPGEQAASAQAQDAQAQGAQAESARAEGAQAQTEGARSGGRRGELGPGAGRVTLPGLVGDLESARQLVEDLGRESVAAQAADLLRAAQVVSALREVLGLGSPPADGARGPEAGGRSPGGELPDDVAARHPGVPGQADGQRPDPTGGPSDASARGGRGRAPRDVEALLWAAWDASGRAEAWRALALEEGGGRGLLAEAAEHHLDVVTALFKRAEVWSERYPGVDGAVFLAELDSELVPSDSVAPQGRRPAGVAVLTPAAAAGEQWEVVVVMGLERDVWPDLRLRDSLTRSGLLVDAVTGRLPLRPDGSLDPGADPASARAQVRGDERRMLVAAMSRASRRLVLTATSDVEHAPSSFLLEVAASAGLPVTDVDGAPLTSPDAGDLTLRGLVGELRQAAVRGALDSATPAERARGAAAVTLLADLARRGVPGASPTTWLDVAGPTSTSPLTALDQRVRVSPSDVESLSTCPLRWFLSRHGGDRPASGAQHLGSLVHALAEQAEREHLRGPALRARAEELLPGLGYPQTWLGRVQQRRVREMVGRLDAYLADCDALGVTAQVELTVRADTVLAPGDLSEDLGGYLEDLLALTGAGAGLRLRIAGRVDRLERRADGSVRVIDLKTGRLVPSSPERHPQLATYRLALEALGRVVGGGALVLLGKEPGRRSGEGYVLAPAGGALDPSPVQDPDTGESRPWAQDLLAAAALGSLGPLYEARSGDHCRNCAVKDSCPVRSEGKRVTQ
ncbi:PD-(D/E)XK nuclease family protein [uncultured Actinomyces sp.]|uniref:PD-(D/E)XK nuclease family protein n=1 Tax=uncultured Actinomyces sp. TaxID=249061 RepID=UPI0028EF9DBB|nr:PD-(D/E)XK nuclease family protein [uncultured Actinomyces sp.]